MFLPGGSLSGILVADGNELGGLAVAATALGAVKGAATGEDASEGIVVLDSDGIELVIVTAGTAYGQSEYGTGGGIDLFVDHLHLEDLLVALVENFRTESEEAGGGETFLACGIRGAGFVEEIAGQLLADELVVGLVLVEGGDHVVAVAPGMGIGEIALHSVRFAEAGHVEPVPPPAFSEMGRSKELVDKPGPRFGDGTLVIEEGIDLLDGGREPDEVKVESSHQGAAIGVSDWFQSLGFHGGEDEAVDSGEGPVAVLHGRGVPFRRRNERPELASLLVIDFSGLEGFAFFDAGVGSTKGHPLCQGRDLLLGEFLLRHLEIIIGMPDGGDEEALFRIAGNDGGPAVATADYTLLVVESEASLDLFPGRVALVAAVHQDGSHALLEEAEVSGVELLGRGRGGGNRADGHKQDARVNSQSHGQSMGEGGAVFQEIESGRARQAPEPVV